MAARERVLCSGRVFASHYQFVLCEDPERPLADDENWTDALLVQGFAGAPEWRMIGTDADLNDHWIELALGEAAPDGDDWHRIVCCDFQTRSGAVHVMGLMDEDPAISAHVAPGPYAAYVCVLNPGIDQQTTGELEAGAPQLSDQELAARDDLERYRVVLVSGAPVRTGVLKEADGGSTALAG